jgi:hypothetical protein
MGTIQLTGGGAPCSDFGFSPGRQIHSSTYNNNPTPKVNKQKMKATRHIQDGIGVAAPNPPHTPPIQRSLDDFVAAFRFCQALIFSSDGLIVSLKIYNSLFFS